MKPLIVANWKCNPATLKGAKLLLDSVKKEIKNIKNIKNIEVVICPPFAYLSSFRFQGLGFRLGAQDCFWEEKGAFTGEISPLMLKNLGCEYVILGHSERRRYFQETDEMINKKIKAALRVGLKPILCVGETEKERKTGKTKKVLKGQLKEGLKDIQHSKFNILNSLVVIAYEPVWAIGTGKSCDIGEAREINLFVKSLAKKPPVLYGGSVNSKNGADYIKNAGFDGLLVGGASLQGREFGKIVKRTAGS